MRRSRSPWVVIGVAVTAALVVLALAGLVVVVYDVPLDTLTYDTTSLTEEPAYTGSVSMLNIMLWSAMAAMAALAAWTFREERTRMALFAVLTAAMAADDALRLHEGVGPRIGIPEELFYVAYAIAGLWLARAFWPWRAGGPGWAYYLGAAFLASSILVDYVAGQLVLLEDGSKLVGTFVWLTVPVLVFADHLGGESRGTASRARATAGSSDVP